MKYEIGSKLKATKALELLSAGENQVAFTADSVYVIKYGDVTGKMIIDNFGTAWHVDDDMLSAWFIEPAPEENLIARYLYAMGVME